jgi:hypothetical protein
LPNPRIIPLPRKVAGMIPISSKEICGEDDFRYPSLKEVRSLAVKNGAIRLERVDMIYIWPVHKLGDNLMVTAVIDTEHPQHNFSITSFRPIYSRHYYARCKDFVSGGNSPFFFSGHPQAAGSNSPPE